MARVSRKAAISEERESSLAASPEKIYNAAAYVRLSVEGADLEKNRETISTQHYMLERYIETQPDMRLAAVFCDNGETGTDFERPGFEQMMDRVRDREIDCIVVKDLSRFGRNYVEAGYYLEKIFPYLGVRFVAVNDGYDTLKDKGGNEMVLSLKNLVNDLYAKDISRKICSSLDTKRKNGEYIGGVPPYGYLKSPEDRHRLVPDPDAAPVVRRIFQWRADGMAVAQIARRLNEERIPSPAMHYYQKGIRDREPSETGRIWLAAGIRRMLENIVYVGHVAQGKTRKSLSEGIPQTDVSRDRWIIVENMHPPIVDRELFDRVQEIMGERHSQSMAIRGKHGTAENVFKGLLVCADCGRKMVRHKNVTPKETARYVFVCYVYEQNRGKRGCTKKYVREQDIQEAVSRSLSLQMEAVLDLERKIKKEGCLGAREKELDGRLKCAQQKTKRNTALRSTLYESLCEGTLTKKEYLSLKAEYDRKAAELEKETASIRQEAAEFRAQSASWERWAGSIKEYCAFLEGQTITRGMALELIQSIRVSNYNDLEIIWNFQDEFARIAQMPVPVQNGGKGADA